MKNVFGICLLLMSVSIYAATLDGLRSTYKTESSKIIDAHIQSMTKLNQDYVADLKKLENKYQNFGQLENLIKVKNERERFENEKTLTESNFSQVPKDLYSLQKNYFSVFQKKPRTYAVKLLALAKNYQIALEKLKVELTKKGDIDEAIAVKEEIDSLENSPELVQARKYESVKENKPKGVPHDAVAKKESASAKKDRRSFDGPDKNRIRKRFYEFVALAQKQKWTQAVEYVDPKFKKMLGMDSAENILNNRFNLARIANDPRIKIGIRSVDINDTMANVVPKVWIDNKWRDKRSVRWVLVDGDWYLKADDIAPQLKKRMPPPRSRPY